MEVAVRVPELDLPQLLSWLQQHLPQSLMLLEELKSCLKHTGKREVLEFYTDRWPDCQAVACKKNPSEENDVLGVFAINDLALSAILKDSRVVDWSKQVLFHAIPEALCPAIQSLAEEMQAHTSIVKFLLLRATPQELQKIPVPAGMRIASHSLDHVSAINSMWECRSASSEAFITENVCTFPSVVLTTDSGQHVGHMIGYRYGAIGILYVSPQFRRKGYAKVIVSQLSQKYFDEGKDAYVMIKVVIEAPFAAERGVDGELALRSFAEAGYTDTSAPVSIRKVWQTNTENVFDFDIPAPTTFKDWLCCFPIVMCSSEEQQICSWAGSVELLVQIFDVSKSMEVAVRVPELDLPQLLSWLEQHLPQSLMMFGELKGCLKNRGKRQDFEFYTDRWPDCQAVACKLNPSKENDVLGVFAINDLALSAILKDRRVVDWSKRGILHAIPETFCPVIQSVAEEMQAKASVEKVLLLRATSPELQRIPVPAGMRIAAHSLDHLSAIDSTWKYHSASSEAYITEKVHTFPSVVLTTDSGQHVGHMIGCNFGGMMGMLYVFPQFRRKGYAKVIISQLSQKYFDEGENAYVMIEADNEVSLKLHESLGFKHIKNLTWVILHQKTL